LQHTLSICSTIVSTGEHCIRKGVAKGNWLNFLEVMMVEEEAATEKHQLAVDVADDPAIKRLFEKLRDEEAFHVEYLEGEYERLEKALGSES